MRPKRSGAPCTYRAGWRNHKLDDLDNCHMLLVNDALKNVGTQIFAFMYADG